MCSPPYRDIGESYCTHAWHKYSPRYRDIGQSYCTNAWHKYSPRYRDIGQSYCTNAWHKYSPRYRDIGQFVHIYDIVRLPWQQIVNYITCSMLWRKQFFLAYWHLFYGPHAKCHLYVMFHNVLTHLQSYLKIKSLILINYIFKSQACMHCM